MILFSLPGILIYILYTYQIYLGESLSTLSTSAVLSVFLSASGKNILEKYIFDFPWVGDSLEHLHEYLKEYKL
jgi:hypothetical protein